MEKKIRMFLMGVLLISLIIVTYFIIFNAFIDMFDLKLKNALAILSSIFSLLGIIIAATVAIYVMNNNHREAMMMEERRITLQEEIEEREVISALTHILYISHPLSASFREDEVVGEKERQFVKEQVDIMESNARILISKTKNRDDKKFKEITDVSTAILGDCLLLKSNFIKDELLGRTVWLYSKDIYLQALNYLDNKEYFPYKDVAEKLKNL